MTAYQSRALEQCRLWSEGKPMHNEVDDECCPDFSCCVPGMFERSEHKRQARYVKQQQEYGVIQ